jgi:hypothetical protein
VTASVPVLLFEAAGHLLGVDPDCVTAVSSTPGAAKRCRALRVRTPEGGRDLAVDHILGVVELPREEMVPLTPSLRAFGAAEWILGSTRHGERFVWLVQRSKAIAALEELSR